MRTLISNIAAAQAVVPIGIVLVGCDSEPKTVWSTSISSPDDKWIATARTDQWVGPGNNALATIVTLRRSFEKARPVDVLVLDQNKLHLQPLPQWSGAAISWQSPTKFKITYHQSSAIEFQAVRAFGDIDISAEVAP